MLNQKISSMLMGVLVFILCSCGEPLSSPSIVESGASIPNAAITEPFRPTLSPEPPSATKTEMASSGCIKTFVDFVMPSGKWTRDNPVIPPLPPWTFQAALPSSHENSKITPLFVMLTRLDQGQKEIWISAKQTNGEVDSQIFLIYKPGIDRWEIIPGFVSGTNLAIRELFSTSDHSVWGQIDYTHLNTYTKALPVLAKYNEETKSFDVANTAGKISGIKSDIPKIEDYSPVVVLDAQDTFWFFTLDGNIFSFHAGKDIPPQKVGQLSDGFAINAALAPDGSIYLQKYPQPYNRGYLANDLLHFFPKTGKIVPLDVPDKRWPMVWISSLLVDHLGQLWIDANGYLDPNGSWHVIHPDMEQLARHVGEPVWSVPLIDLESSDGTLWFYRYMDNNIIDGTAWYNPKTGKGCMFTNRPGTIREDEENTLWLVIEGGLYSHILGKHLLSDIR